MRLSHGLRCGSWEGTGTQEKNPVAIQVCVWGGAPDKVIPSEIGFSEGPKGHEAMPGEGPGCHGWM